ncbi:MAG: pseudouridine synthase [Fusobacteria bacterium]|nr:pseudouridine synthase [Fusobacteriota bacterium]
MNKYISSHFDVSRRKADEWIEKGYVVLNGEKVTQLGIQVKEGDTVEIVEQGLEEKKEFKYYLLNKPIGFVCTHSLNEGQNIFELLPPLAGLTYAGRLDKDSHGLMIVSNDGKFVYKVAGAEHEKCKVYVVKVDAPITDFDLDAMQNGMIIGGKMTKEARVERINAQKFSIELKEGINRQIRRMCRTLGYYVRDLKRVEIHGIKDEVLSEGYWRELTQREIDTILEN